MTPAPTYAKATSSPSTQANSRCGSCATQPGRRRRHRPPGRPRPRRRSPRQIGCGRSTRSARPAATPRRYAPVMARPSRAGRRADGRRRRLRCPAPGTQAPVELDEGVLDDPVHPTPLGRCPQAPDDDIDPSCPAPQRPDPDETGRHTDGGSRRPGRAGGRGGRGEGGAGAHDPADAQPVAVAACAAPS